MTPDETPTEQSPKSAQLEELRLKIEHGKALSAVGTLVNSENLETRRLASEDFWRLYQGEMILVETKSVSEAMVDFGNCLDGVRIACSKSVLGNQSHIPGTAMRESMAETAQKTFQDFAANQFRYR